MSAESHVNEELLPPAEALQRDFILAFDEPGLSEDGPVEKLAFRIGPFGILCAMDLGREVVPPPERTILPHLPAWLTGVANVRGTLVPIIDPWVVFDMQQVTPPRRYLMIFGAAEDAVGLLVDSLPVPCFVEASQRVSGVAPHPAMLQHHLLGCYEREGEVWLDLNIWGFLNALGERIGR